MIEIAAELRSWCADGRPFALATVVGTSGSAPRPAGTALAVDGDGIVIGSVSGGCVEGAVYELATEVLATGVPARASFGYNDTDAFAVGLSCGGRIEVLIRSVRGAASREVLAGMLDAVATGRPVALATVIDGPDDLLGAAFAVHQDRVEGTLGNPALDRSARRDTRALLDRGTSGACRYGRAGDCATDADEVAVFTAVYAVPPRMLIFGAVDFAAAVARIGHFLGYRVTICDARPLFTTSERFPDADEVVVEWPHRMLDRLAAAGELDSRTVLAVLTHDPKFDLPLLERALKLPLGYVGAMGSRRTHTQRMESLAQAGLTSDELARLHSPIGLDLGAITPEETAVSIAAEIVAARSDASGQRLTDSNGPIHRIPTVSITASAVPLPT